MKIGILTFHRAHNYGAVLQAYALQEVLKNMGHNVEFIDYRNPFLLNIYNWFIWRRFITKDMAKAIKELMLVFKRKRRFDKFQHFIQSDLSLSANPYTLTSYDVIIVGSDQVWNTKLTHGFDPMYWGKWNHQNTIVASYAVSMEDYISTNDKKEISELLKNFDYISVREENIKKQLETLSNKKIDVTIDPTLLLDRESWLHIEDKPLINEDYILLYQVRNNEIAEDIAKQISQYLNIRIVHLSARIDLCNNNETISSGPIDFLNLFRHAKFVVCTSFHGTIFSLIYHIPFCSVILNDGNDARVTNILSQVGLSERGVSEYTNHLFSSVNWPNVDEKIYEIRQKSMNYLKQFC
jgi:hypothetical protein